jgi:hypothetical protein
MDWVAVAAMLFVAAWAWTFMAIRLWRREEHEKLRRRINDYTMK